MSNLPVVLHERLGYWSRHLRPRLDGWPVRWVESRSTSDLLAAVTAAACPIVVVDLARRPCAGLDDIDRALRAAPGALMLALDPDELPGVRELARQLGATLTLSGVAPPPRLAELLARWIPLARQRAASQGWARALPPQPEPEPWNWLNPLLAEPSQPLR